MVKECNTDDCLIQTFRFGKNPARAGIGLSRDRMIKMVQKRMAVSH